METTSRTWRHKHECVSAVVMDTTDISPSATPGMRNTAWAKAWLMLRVHLDAFRHAPRPYLLAAWWRLRGKRVRARAHFAPLLAVSKHAYGLWLRSEEPVAEDQDEEAGRSIIALIDAAPLEDPRDRPTQARLDATLRSADREGFIALVVGTPQIPTLDVAARHIDWSNEPWLMPLMGGDVLAPGAGSAYRKAAANTQAPLVFADDDLVDTAGHRHTAHFKPAWNAELFRHFDYLTGACIVRAGAADLQQASGPHWAQRLVAAASVRRGGGLPMRLPKVLHHRLSRPMPRIPAVVARSGPLPPVSVIVPTRNGLNLLRTCLDGVARTDYPDIEVIVVDNGSDDPTTLTYLERLDPLRHRVVRHPGPFNFSTLNNRAAAEARGKLLCLLNNDIEVLEPDWLAIMAPQAMRDDVGAVGAQLLYPNRRIQHAGVVLGVGGGAAHAHRLLRPAEEGYFYRHALPQFVSAVTAACLVVQRARFEAVGGLDEANFAVAFNDVDLCMRLNARGWQSFYEPRAKLVHHESVSRGFDRDPAGAARLASEIAALQRLWNTDNCVDPYHHPQLARFSERFVVKL